MKRHLTAAAFAPVPRVVWLVALLIFFSPLTSAATAFYPETHVAAIGRPAGKIVGPHETVLPSGSRPSVAPVSAALIGATRNVAHGIHDYDPPASDAQARLVAVASSLGGTATRAVRSASDDYENLVSTRFHLCRRGGCKWR